MRRDAIIRQLEIVGEAASRVDEGTRNATPDVPWADIIGMRNRLIHGYYVVDDAILWRTVTVRLPELIAMLEGHIGGGTRP